MNLFILRTWLESRLHVGEHDSRGANLVEYVLLLAFIALVVMGIVKLLGTKVSSKFSSAESQL